MQILANTALKKDDYMVSPTFTWYEYGTNKPLMWSGVGVAGAGLAMWAVGASKVPIASSLTIRPGGASVARTVRF